MAATLFTCETLIKSKTPAVTGVCSLERISTSATSIRLLRTIANVPSIFDCINAKADAIKAQRWQTYIPLTRSQLSNRDRQPETLKEDTATVTLDVGIFGQFVVLKRPTEGAALYPDAHRDKIVVRRPPLDLRWCIWCKCRHPFADFRFSPKHYLHGYSYACKRAINERRARHWRYLGQTA